MASIPPPTDTDLPSPHGTWTWESAWTMPGESPPEELPMLQYDENAPEVPFSDDDDDSLPDLWTAAQATAEATAMYQAPTITPLPPPGIAWDTVVFDETPAHLFGIPSSVPHLATPIPEAKMEADGFYAFVQGLISLPPETTTVAQLLALDPTGGGPIIPTDAQYTEGTTLMEHVD